MKEIMTVDDAAALLSVHPQTIRKWVRNGEITGADTPAGYRFTPADIQEWMAKYRQPKKAQSAASAIHMTALTFDTLAYVKTLRDAGVEEKQAEAQATALATVLKSGAGDLATGRDLTELRTLIKQDIDRVESKLNLIEERTEGRFKLLQWMLGFNLAISIALLWILIRTATH